MTTTVDSGIHSKLPHAYSHDSEKILVSSSGDAFTTFENQQVNSSNTENKSYIESDSEDVVGWEGPSDPLNPRNFSMACKITNIFLIHMVCCLNLTAIAVMAPAVPDILKEFNSNSLSLSGFVVSIYILGFGCGPIFMAPVSEIIGRVPVYNFSVFGFVLSNIACAKSTSLGMLTALRFLSGIFGSVTETNTSATISDLFIQSERGLIMTLYSIGPAITIAVAPVIGGYVAQALGWRWIFWLISIFSGFFGLLGGIFFRETYSPIILRKKAARLCKETGNKNLQVELADDIYSKQGYLKAFLRPTRLLIFSPPILSTAIYLGILHGVHFLMVTTYTPVFMHKYHLSTGSVSLIYLGGGIGNIIGLVIFAWQTNRVFNSKASVDSNEEDKSKINGLKNIEPESRLNGLVLGHLLIPIGLLLYGWTAEKKVHWIVPVIGTGLIGCGSFFIIICILTYIMDCFPLHAASASTGSTLLRSVLGSTIPLAGGPMFKALGAGKSSSLLAIISIIMIPFPWALVKYSGQLRKRYPVKNI